MRRAIGVGTILVALIAGGHGMGAEPPCCEPPRDCCLNHLGPVGGWNPGGGLLRWWQRHCFPCCGAPDDYCRKPLPPVCWPPYPPYYQWGPPEIGFPRDCSRAH